MRWWWLVLSVLFVIAARPVLGQQEGVLFVDDPVHRFLLRQQADGRLPRAHLSHLPLSAREAARYLDTLDAHRAALRPADARLLDRFLGRRDDGRRGPAWLYPDGENLAVVEGEGYRIAVNPLVYAAAGPARHREAGGRHAHDAAWQYARGVRVGGRIGPHLFFETRLTEGRTRPVWPAAAGGTAPRYGFVELQEGTYDYFAGTGVVGLRSRFFEVRFGRDGARWGPGAGSLVLSDYAAPYDQLQIRTTVGPFQYVNLFAALTETRYRKPGQTVAIPRKYFAMHRLSADLPAGFQVGVFESVIFSADTVGSRRGFDVAYLNPIIFYRAVERDLGSPDNVLLGADAAWVAAPGLRLYGQLLLDEMQVRQIGRDWWGNKWGFLAGLHLADRPVPGLSLRAEYARLRPYLYSHRSPATDYVHYGDLLGHPAGPNAVDLAFLADYQPAPRWHAALTVALTRHGRNTGGLNYGGDPLLPYTNRSSDFDAHLLQGVRQRLLLVEGYGGYELLPGLTLEAGLTAESVDDAEIGRDRYVLPFALVRWGLPFRSVRY